MPRGGLLSADLFHPDCECCGAAGDLNVTGNQTPSPGEWWCLECESAFDVGLDSPWHGLDDLPETTRGVYIDRAIRGLDAKQVAQIRHVDARVIPTLVARVERDAAAARAVASE